MENADGSHLHELTRDPALKENAVWSPTGKEIAFLATSLNTSLGSGTYLCDEIYTVRSDGTHMRRISPPDASDCPPAWSPDGHHLAFIDVTGNLVSQHLVLTSANGKHRRSVAYAANGFDGYSWSPDGKRIAFANIDPGDLYIYDLRSRRTVDLAPVLRRAHPSTRGWPLAGPAWSPDGRWLAVDAGAAGGSDEPGLYVVRADGKASYRVEPHFRTDAVDAPQWLPGGAKLLAEGDRGIYVLDVKRHMSRPLGLVGNVVSWSLSPDGKRIVYGDDRLRFAGVG